MAESPDCQLPAPTTARPDRRRTLVWASRLALLLIVLLGAALRTMSLFTWDSGTGQHPDERFFADVTSRVRIPAGVVAYFDSARSLGNPRNVERTFYVYGSFPPLAARLVAVMLTPPEQLPQTVPDTRLAREGMSFATLPQTRNPELDLPRAPAPLRAWLNPDGDNMTSYTNLFKVGRALVVGFDLATLLLLYLMVRRLFGRGAALLAALLAALSVLHIQQSHFFVDPVFSTFFAVWALYFAVRAAQGGGWFSFVLMGFGIGAAMGNRITLATLGLVGIVAALHAALAEQELHRAAAAHAGESPSPPPRFWHTFWRHKFPLLALAAVVALLSFRVVQPYAFIGSTIGSPPVIPR